MMTTETAGSRGETAAGYFIPTRSPRILKPGSSPEADLRPRRMGAAAAGPRPAPPAPAGQRAPLLDVPMVLAARGIWALLLLGSLGVLLGYAAALPGHAAADGRNNSGSLHAMAAAGAAIPAAAQPPPMSLQVKLTHTELTCADVLDRMNNLGLGPAEVTDTSSGLTIRSRPYRDVAEMTAALVRLREAVPAAWATDRSEAPQWVGEVFRLPERDGEVSGRERQLLERRAEDLLEEMRLGAALRCELFSFSDREWENLTVIDPQSLCLGVVGSPLLVAEFRNEYQWLIGEWKNGDQAVPEETPGGLLDTADLVN